VFSHQLARLRRGPIGAAATFQQAHRAHPCQCVIDNVAQESAGSRDRYQIAGHIPLHSIPLCDQFPRNHRGFAPHTSAQEKLDHTLFCGKPKDPPSPKDDITASKKMKKCAHDGLFLRRMAVLIRPDV
jgi:hypothetical protein